MKKLKLLAKLGCLWVSGKTVTKDSIGESYTKVSMDYEVHFLKTMHTYNDLVLKGMIEEGPKEVHTVLDLACGTGYNSAYLKKFYKEATYTLVDLSKGMLEEAKKKDLGKALYNKQDMLGFLKEQKDESFDAVVCCWAIKYQPPQKVIKEVYRILKPGGVFGVIVNTKETLPEIRSIYPKLLISEYHAINKVMLELPNPAHKKVFDRWFTKEGFTLLRGAEDQHIFSFENERELAKWITHTGALAGFDVMIDLKNKRIQDKMRHLLKQEGIDQVTHAFVWGIFKK